MMGGSDSGDDPNLDDLLDGMVSQTDEIESILDEDDKSLDDTLELPVEFVEREGSVDVFRVGDKEMVPKEQVVALLLDLTRELREPLEGVGVEQRTKEAEEFIEWAENADPLVNDDGE